MNSRGVFACLCLSVSGLFGNCTVHCSAMKSRRLACSMSVPSGWQDAAPIWACSPQVGQQQFPITSRLHRHSQTATTCCDRYLCCYSVSPNITHLCHWMPLDLGDTFAQCVTVSLQSFTVCRETECWKKIQECSINALKTRIIHHPASENIWLVSLTPRMQRHFDVAWQTVGLYRRRWGHCEASACD